MARVRSKIVKKANAEKKARTIIDEMQKKYEEKFNEAFMDVIMRGSPTISLEELKKWK